MAVDSISSRWAVPVEIELVVLGLGGADQLVVTLLAGVDQLVVTTLPLGDQLVATGLTGGDVLVVQALGEGDDTGGTRATTGTGEGCGAERVGVLGLGALRGLALGLLGTLVRSGDALLRVTLGLGETGLERGDLLVGVGTRPCPWRTRGRPPPADDGRPPAHARPAGRRARHGCRRAGPRPR